MAATEYTVKDVTKYIQTFAFEGCTNLKKVTLPESMCIIKKSAFESCTNLESVNFSNVYYIGDRAFYGCKSMS